MIVKNKKSIVLNKKNSFLFLKEGKRVFEKIFKFHYGSTKFALFSLKKESIKCEEKKEFLKFKKAKLKKF